MPNCNPGTLTPNGHLAQAGTAFRGTPPVPGEDDHQRTHSLALREDTHQRELVLAPNDSTHQRGLIPAPRGKDRQRGLILALREDARQSRPTLLGVTT